MGYYLKIGDLLLQICTNIVLNYVISVDLNFKSMRKCYRADDRHSLGIKAGHDTRFRWIEARIRFTLWFGGDTIFFLYLLESFGKVCRESTV